MDQPGRKSVENLRLVTPLPGQRVEPPRSLTEDQAEVWRAVVATKPAEWFQRDTLPLLFAYCKAVIEHERVSAVIDGVICDEKEETIRKLDALHRMQDRQAKLMVQVATKMRLTPQSRYTPQAAATANKKAAVNARPWD